MLFAAFSPAAPAGADTSPTLAPMVPPAGGTGVSTSGNLGAGPVLEPPKSDPITDDIHDVPARVLAGGSAWDSYGSRVVSVGDLNGDGAGELAVVSRNPWAVHVLVASAGGFAALGALTLSGNTGEIYGASVAGGGDLNGDGFGDLTVSVGRLDASGAYLYDVDVFYGSLTLTPGPAALSIRAPSLPGAFGAGLAIVSDMDGDSFDDLVVSAPPPPSSARTGSVWVYRGARAGVPATPSWSFSFPTPGIAFGAGASAAGDLNGDGLGDFVVTTGGAPVSEGRSQVFVFYGGSGLNVAGPTTLVAEQAQDGFGSSVSYGDFNGDGRADVLVGAPGYDRSPELADAGRAYEFYGAVGSVASAPSGYQTGSPGSKFATAVAGLGDLNGDGIEDAAVGAPLASADGPVTNGQIFVYFGSAAGLPDTYDFTEAGETGNDLYGIATAGRLDLDADGRGDLAVGASGRDTGGFTDAGCVYLYSGSALRMPPILPNAFAIRDLTDGRALARLEAPYRLDFTLVYRGPTNNLQAVEQTLTAPSLGQSIMLSWSPGASGAQEAGDALHLVEIQPSSSFMAASPLLHSYTFSVPVKFSWAFNEPRPVAVQTQVRDNSGASAKATVSSAFSVVSTLAFSAPLELRRSDGSFVAPGEFVRGGDRLEWSGGGLVYAGTRTPPPVGEIQAEVANEGGLPSALTVDGQSGNVWGIRPAKGEEDAGDLHTLSVTGTTGELLTQASVLVGIDSSAPVFGQYSISSGTHLTQNPALISVRVLDPLSGVRAASVEWSSSLSAASGFATWHPAEASSGGDVVATASVPLAEGVATWIQFRALDAVGNGYALSTPLNVTLDYGAVVFSQAVPRSGAWSRVSDVPVTFTVANDRAVLLDFSTLEYLVIAGQTGLWTSAGLDGRATSGEFSTTLTLPDGARNAVHLRIRLADRPDLYQSPPFYIQVDSRPAAIEVLGPSPSTWVTTGSAASVVMVTDSTSGPVESSVRYRYLPQGADVWSTWLVPTLEVAPGGYRATGIVPVRDGVDNFVVWKAQDIALNDVVTSSYQRIVADSRPIGFDHPVPANGARLESVNRISIDVTDGDGSGVDLSTVEYKVDLAGGLTTGWRSAGREGFITRASVSVPITLPEGTSVISWRGQDAARTPVSLSAPVEVAVSPVRPIGASPLARLSSPLSGAHYPTGVDIKFDASSSRDPEGSPLDFRWSVDGVSTSDSTKIFWMRLSPGEHTVTLVVDDGASPPASKTVRFTVDGPVGPPSPFSSAAEQAMLAAFAGLLAGALAVRVWARRAGRRLVR